MPFAGIISPMRTHDLPFGISERSLLRLDGNDPYLCLTSPPILEPDSPKSDRLFLILRYADSSSERQPLELAKVME
jgi:hypothetical protein